MKSHPHIWKATLGCLTLALAGSFWAFFGKGDCGTCEGRAPLPSTLAAAGIAYYSLLLAGAIGFGPSAVVSGGLLLAGASHTVLLSVLLWRGTFCPPCILTGVAAVGGALGSFFLDPQNLVRATWILPGAALAWNSVLAGGGGMSPAVPQAEITSRVAEEEKISTPQPGEPVRMIVYSRPDCRYCQDLEQDILPRLKSQFGETLEVTWRSARELPGIPTPTILIIGPGGRRFFPGLPAERVLRTAILETQLPKEAPHAVLPTSR